ncbi:Zinc finger protein sdz-12 [Caenorhabditis elegans]|uniref:Zinc finger protein sdz-12 n=1 Tax=Caenorhabditis elegans TaxID=6239 RepID=SDZ12_CAEEL|nr:Zinc finger protein sdz-12 [Caenorhabditis elegans]Q9BLC4.1 RecName: Full=Zinc finger protein sdz-12; AltName: Full=Skn-1-dependent zygotic transcript 12 protein [Caenorhabditis elegans]CCD67483.1 Zinc finger protein sdz-12 [Caenorhabditis elegans]|eukprot:NP_494634.1 SKN-1 Dependent Zygotic transcript [Caenorhabditis elegans]
MSLSSLDAVLSLIATSSTLDQDSAKVPQCQVCKRKFANQKTLRTHMKHITCRPGRSNVVNHKFRCENCEKQFTNKPNLKRHQITHSGSKSKKCSTCQRTFFREDQLQRHLHNHLKERSHFDCPVLNCSMQFVFYEGVENHLVNHHHFSYSESAPCGKCHKLFGSPRHLLVHYHFDHKEALRSSAPAPTSSARLSPITVSTSGSPRAQLAISPQEKPPQKLSINLGTSPMIEEFCEQNSATLPNTDQQLSPTLSPNEPRFRNLITSEPTPSFECKHCTIKFHDATMSIMHNALHAPGSPFKCAICGAECGNKIVFTMHIITASHDFGGIGT